MASLVTFSRRKGGLSGKSASEADADDTVTSAASAPSYQSYATAQSVLTPVAESPLEARFEPGSGGAGENDGAAANSGGPAGPPRRGKWRRRAAPTVQEKQAADREAYMQEMRAYFEEVDSFELEVETPTPPIRLKPQQQGKGEAGAAARAAVPGSSLRPGEDGLRGGRAGAPGSTVRPMRPMSLGLSRRSSAVPPPQQLLASAKKGVRPSPLRISSLARTAAGADGPGRTIEGAVPRGRASSSSRFSLAHRMSVAADNAAIIGGDGQQQQAGAGRRSSISHYGLGGPAYAGRRSSIAPAAGRRSSVAGGGAVPPQRLSIAGRMMSRLSLGLSDALHWLGVRGSVPTAAGTAGVAEAETTTAAGEGAAEGWVDRPSRRSAAVGEVPPGGSQLSPIIASPTGEGEEGEEAGMQQQQQQQQVALGRALPAVSPILESPEGSETSPAQQPGGQSDEAMEAGMQQQQQQQEVAAAIPEEADEEAAADAVAVEGLRAQLEEKLALVEGSAAEEPEGAVPVESGQPAAVASVAADLQAATWEAAEEELAPLEQLLALCGQEGSVEALPTMDALLGQHVDLSKVRKIGEGTFGEAFKAGRVVFKIVPMEGDTLRTHSTAGLQKRAEEILAEVAITLTLSGLRGPGSGVAASPGVAAEDSSERPENVTAGFVETFGVGVCRGRYAAALRREWHRWDKQHGSENDAVDAFGRDQLFVVFVVADGGLDLEHIELRSFEEMRSVLMQVALTLAVAEEACEFEHRDLHWGNLLIHRGGGATAAYRLRGVDISAQTEGVSVTLIDFTLSRLVTAGGEVAFCDLSADPELFKGPKGDCQAETYRRMKKATRGDWRRHAPTTNVLWTHYLADICLTHKLTFPCRHVERGQLVDCSWEVTAWSSHLGGNGAQKLELRNFRKRSLGYVSATELVWDEWLRAGWAAATE
eukprot:scaffold8.g1644.t1